MTKRSVIERFARDTLGCNCPDEVFDTIDCRRGDPATDVYGVRIAIGGRLLVYVLEADSPGVVEEMLSRVLGAGKADRDEQGMNRFRAVLATDQVEPVEKTARRIFDGYSQKDEKVHLHILRKGEVSGVYAECR